MGDVCGVPGSCLHPGSDLAVVALSGVNQGMEYLSVSPYVPLRNRREEQR